MLILGIETSCDETSVAIVENGKNILSVKTYSQIKEHEKYGGVVPEIASRIHAEVIHFLLKDLLTETQTTLSQIDLLSVTNAPGLIGALMVGVSFANGLAFALKKPIIGINHLEAHLYAGFMGETEPELPALALLVSGGHSSLILIHKLGHYQLLGSTIDDAVGESFDKVAKMLRLPYPGGPQIDKLSKTGNPKAFDFPRSLLKDRPYDMSLSGLKTSVLYLIQGTGKNKTPLPLTDENVANVCASFQQTVIDTLLWKTEYALNQTKARSLMICGGVAANRQLQTSMKDLGNRHQIPVFIPPLSLCTDNASMIAGLAFHKQDQAKPIIKNIQANQMIGINN